mgnify:CR=1 FL=1
MCNCGGPPKPPPLPKPRPTAPAPERTAKAVVTGKQRKTKDKMPSGTARIRSGTESLRIRKAMGNSQGGNLNL